MSGLDDLPIQVGAPGPSAGQDFGNALPILGEVRHALRHLIDAGEPGCIDLAAMPFGPGDEERLRRLLGDGEVVATVEALGPTRIRETAIPGVWLVDYRNADDQRVALQLEIAEVPRILRSQPEDLEDALERLDALLAEARTESTDTRP